MKTPPRTRPDRARKPAAPAAARGPSALDVHAGRLLLALMALHAALFTAVDAYKYRQFLYTDFDLAIFAHAVSQALHGTLYESIGGMRWLGGHVSPVLFLLAPLYAIARHPLALLAVQNVALAAAAWPVYRLARRESGSGAAALACAVAWLLQPALGYLALFEFHPETLAVPALLFAIDALREGRTRATLLWAALALLTREDVALVTIALAAVSLAWTPRRPALAGMLAALGAASLVLSFAVIMPLAGSAQTDYATMYGRWGHSVHEVLGAVLRDPARAFAELFATPGDAQDSAFKPLYYVHVLLPFAFVPLASPLLLAAALPVLFEHFLSSRLSAHTIVFHYTALVLPFAGAALALGLGTLSRRARGAAPAIGALVLAGAVASQVLYGPFGNVGALRTMGPPESLRAETYDRALTPYRDAFVRRVPREGGVIAGFELLSHFTGRTVLHALHHFLGGHYTFSTRAYAVPRDVSAVIGDLGNGSLFKHVDDGTAGRWRELLAANDLKPADSADDLVLFTRSPRDTAALWAVAEPPAPRTPPVTYDGAIAFTGASVDSGPVHTGERVTMRTYWRRAAATNRFFLTEIVLLGPDGKPAFELWRYLGYTMHPVAEWPEGASVCETYRLVVPPDLAPGRYAVGVRLWWRREGQGVCEADDPRARADAGYVEAGAFTVTPR